jgi:hypothetical protein
VIFIVLFFGCRIKKKGETKGREVQSKEVALIFCVPPLMAAEQSSDGFVLCLATASFQQSQ